MVVVIIIVVVVVVVVSIGSVPLVISKIESTEALENFDS